MNEPTDRHQPRHVDRRDQGMRRQRLVTQAAAGGATALALLFGWAFAQPTPAPAAEQPAAPAKQPPATKKPPAAKKPAAKQPAAETEDEPELKAPEEPPVEEPPQEEAAPPPDTRSGGS
ncbi:hypothetical protein RB614_30315 [Phytohabitans sp. ZYX-F-186]|uniref:Uncharacterized protein n=1 Tax=Phytohabitans maris TaxID=3071409 RepID=A0ABU0ZP65_9ACTN|nr:hypothetical protein [Phytohabitans sp. ZYX-F-186]MDQ7908836.1 hypothetical protein [Phytohabitans sp. ZYX-F-186]